MIQAVLLAAVDGRGGVDNNDLSAGYPVAGPEKSFQSPHAADTPRRREDLPQLSESSSPNASPQEATSPGASSAAPAESEPPAQLFKRPVGRPVENVPQQFQDSALRPSEAGRGVAIFEATAPGSDAAAAPRPEDQDPARPQSEEYSGAPNPALEDVAAPKPDERPQPPIGARPDEGAVSTGTAHLRGNAETDAENSAQPAAAPSHGTEAAVPTDSLGPTAAPQRAAAALTSEGDGSAAPLGAAVGESLLVAPVEAPGMSAGFRPD